MRSSINLCNPPLPLHPFLPLQVILACEGGGTLQPSVSFPQGKVSRSLKAAWKVGDPGGWLASSRCPSERRADQCKLCGTNKQSATSAHPLLHPTPYSQVVASQALPAERVKHLEGGVYRWYSLGLPMDGQYDPSNAGKTPNTAEAPTGAYIDKQ